MARLPVLMYHHISAIESRGLTTGVKQLEAQFTWLCDNNFRCWYLSELEDLSGLPPGNNVVITFDDAYVSFKEFAMPLLRKYQLKSMLFVPLAYLGRTDEWNTGRIPIMTADELNSLDPACVELGYHSFAHKKYHEMSSEAIKEDLEQCRNVIAEKKLSLYPALAYPYGKYPRTEPAKTEFTDQLKEYGFTFGLRIGNRLNSFPFKKPFEIQRLDIKGEFSLKKFSRKIKFGKLL